ncbi:hypothetical protein MUG94_10070 [Arthrobacter gengyunqii]|uniref:AbiEi antitoxin C-terminal domain-containing protein n=1 Tax=Arthrobacter gengyunqii TaxID=2886940 RepID=A0A9X1M157_9MICC|nr:hypothetical protein [Arthrobacter gengyunqii]MCC3269101.1 hypothetical protein [Arthrobacter gengyunqii]UOY94932.1 hypothetical protein MUG94_10070 [Arthrobacter gengyunqii]
MPATLFPCPGVLPAFTSTGGALFFAGGDFSSVELQAMERDGLLRRVYPDTYVRWDIEPDPVCRALAAAHALPARLRQKIMLGRFTAAWVYGCAPAPRKLQLLIDHRSRTTALPPFSAAVLHEVQLDSDDGMDIAGIAVTTPLRTAADLARHGPEEEAVRALTAMAAHPVLRCPLAAVRKAVSEGPRQPGKSAALRRVDLAISQADGQTRRREPVVR